MVFFKRFLLLMCVGSFFDCLWANNFVPSNSKKELAMINPTFRFKRMKDCYKKRDYKEVINDCRSLISLYPQSPCARECLYFYGKSLMKMGKHYRSFLKFQELLKKYPNFEKKEEIIGSQAQIGRCFFNKASSHFFSFGFQYARAIEIFQSTLYRDPYGPHAEYAHFYLAESYRLSQDYESAFNCYKLLLDHFPEGSYRMETVFKIALMEAVLSRKSLYGNHEFESQLLKFEAYVQSHKMMPRFKKVQTELNLLKKQMSDKVLSIASYYEKKEKYQSALLYYKDFHQKYCDENQQIFAEKKIRLMRKKLNKVLNR